MPRLPEHQRSALASMVILMGGVAYTVGQVVVTFVFKVSFMIISIWIGFGSATPPENDIVVAPFDTALLAGAVGLALIVLCVPRLWDNRPKRSTGPMSVVGEQGRPSDPSANVDANAMDPGV